MLATSLVDIILSTACLLVVAALGASLVRRRKEASSMRLPPGPRPLPLIGNLFDMPTKNVAPTFHQICRNYGDIVYLSVFGQSTVVIDSYDAAVELLEQRSLQTSDRPRLVMAELAGLAWEFSVEGYTPAWRRSRRTFHEFFHQGAVRQYHSTHQRETVGGAVMDTVYGIDVVDDKNRYVAIARRGAEIFGEITTPGRFLVELFPSLAGVPAWFPGAQFQRDAKAWTQELLAVKSVAFDKVVDQMARGCAPRCMAHDLMERVGKGGEQDVSKEDEEHFRDVTGIAYVAGVDTTYTLMTAFFLAMIKFPDHQRRAQAELDAVVGPDRLPDFSDRDSLSYVNAMLKECVRWHTVLPLAIPHATTHGQEYNGLRIPAGSVLLANVWAMAHDPVAYPNPDSFSPERFLKDGQLDGSVRDPLKFQFGFGRRICPGRHYALDSAFLMIASVLHVFDIKPPVGQDGTPMKVDPHINFDSALSHPDSFQCRIVPRSPGKEALVRQAH
ncbi:cytochrome P450 [Ganoderma sinense ZZ0214-1]|uniref:Cytochrome P450 n=1 Tax=Ganoderma sinense ZZ0214-1 TaxID=1077348 RepID=A0A2G8RPU5_9APHY|nr:cytochrome P450 [Ganoderma sinense ZZ0214-1]